MNLSELNLAQGYSPVLSLLNTLEFLLTPLSPGSLKYQSYPKSWPELVAFFFKIRHYVTPKTLKLLYYSLFYSFLSYGIAIWGLTYPSVLDLLLKVQRELFVQFLFRINLLTLLL